MSIELIFNALNALNNGKNQHHKVATNLTSQIKIFMAKVDMGAPKEEIEAERNRVVAMTEAWVDSYSSTSTMAKGVHERLEKELGENPFKGKA